VSDVRELLSDAAARPAGGPDTDAVLRRARSLQRRRRAAGGAAALVVLPLLVLGAGVLLRANPITFVAPTPSVVGVPPPGEVAPAELNDGTPVWVLNDEDGEVRVLEAVDPHGWYSMRALVAWCPTAHTFEAPGTASRWDIRGRWMAGPSGRDLGTFEVDYSADGATARVGRLRVPDGRSATADDPRGPSCDMNTAPPGLADDMSEEAVYPLDLDQFETLTAEEALAAAPAEPVIVTGTLLLRAGETAVVCSDPQPAADPRCDVALAMPQTGWDADGWFSIAGRYLGVVRDGELRDVTWLPGAIYDSAGAHEEIERLVRIVHIDWHFDDILALLVVDPDLANPRDQETDVLEVHPDTEILGSEHLEGADPQTLSAVTVPPEGIVARVTLFGGMRVLRLEEVADPAPGS
jgi:hypothetical protein